MIACSVLWVLAYAGVRELPKATLSAYGFSFEMSRPEAIFIVLRAVFGYFLCRYSIYVLDYQEQIRQAFVQVVRQRSAEQLLLANIRKTLGVEEVSIHGPWPPDAWRLWKDPMVVSVSPDGGATPRDVTLNLGKSTIARLLILGTIRFVLADKVVTDVLLPFVFAFAVAQYASHAAWGGNVRNLLAP